MYLVIFYYLDGSAEPDAKFYLDIDKMALDIIADDSRERIIYRIDSIDQQPDLLMAPNKYCGNGQAYQGPQYWEDRLASMQRFRDESEKNVIHLLKQLRAHYPTLTTTDIIVAALEELLAQNTC
jgi:hypothetical protein